MGDVCTDGRFDLIERFKRDLVEATNIETSPEEMAVLGSILFRMWQMGWLDKLAASPWHRVEEPPKKDGKYIVCWKDGGGFCYDTAWWTSVGTWSLSHWTGVTVAHWMPIEPPKEDEHGN